jgi:hypothetical protein
LNTRFQPNSAWLRAISSICEYAASFWFVGRRRRLVLQRLGVQRHRGAGYARPHLPHLIEVLKRQQGLVADVGDRQRRRRQRALLVVDRRAKPRAAQRLRVVTEFSSAVVIGLFTQ